MKSGITTQSGGTSGVEQIFEEMKADFDAFIADATEFINRQKEKP